MGRSCDMYINAHVTCTWPPGKQRAFFECTRRHDKCHIDGESVTQRAPHGSRPKKKKVQVVSQLVIEQVSEEVVVEELTRKAVMQEEAPVEVAAPEEVPVVNVPPCLEELIWATLQEVRKMCESTERCEHFEFHIWEELRKLVTEGQGSVLGARECRAGRCRTGECHSGKVPGGGEREKEG